MFLPPRKNQQQYQRKSSAPRPQAKQKMLLTEQSMCCVFYRLTIEGNKYLTNKQNVLECKNKTKKTYQPTKQKTDRQKPPKHTAEEEYGQSPREKELHEIKPRAIIIFMH